MNNQFHGFLRVGEEKIYAGNLGCQAWRHDWHNLRKSLKSAPTADPLAPGPELILGDPAGLKKSIEKVLNEFGIKPYGKTSVVAAELVFTVNSEFFGGKGISSWDVGKVQAWKGAVLKMIRKVFEKRIAAIIYHADESAPHLHVYVVPVVKHKRVAQWHANSRKPRYQNAQVKLCGREFFTRYNLIRWQDEYGHAITPLGLLRGRRGSDATHKKMRDTQRDLEISVDVVKQNRKTLEESADTAKKLINDNEKLKKKLIAAQDDVKRDRDKLDQERLEFDRNFQALEDTKKHLEAERSRLRSIPVALVANRLGFVDAGNGEHKARLPHESIPGVEFDYRLLLEADSFRVEAFQRDNVGNWDWKKKGSGKGAIDFMRALKPSLLISEICNRLAELFPDNKAGIALEFLQTRTPGPWDNVGQPPRGLGTTIDEPKDKDKTHLLQ